MSVTQSFQTFRIAVAPESVDFPLFSSESHLAERVGSEIKRIVMHSGCHASSLHLVAGDDIVNTVILCNEPLFKGHGVLVHILDDACDIKSLCWDR